MPAGEAGRGDHRESTHLTTTNQTTPPSNITFAQLNLAEPVRRALDEAGYTTPTPIQGLAIPPALLGRDVLGIAQTGTGKTAAFALPIIHRLLTMPAARLPKGPTPPPAQGGRGKGRQARREPPFLPRALILSPTRELATQITESFNEYARHAKLRHTAIFGGVSQFRQEKALERGVDIVVATPGRLIDLMDQGLTDFSAVRTLVLDEADRMLDMGFIHPIRRIAEELPEPRQTLLFSATMPPAIAQLASSLLKEPVRVEAPRDKANLPKIEQSVHMVDAEAKHPLLERMLGEGDVERAVVFTRTKHGADRLARRLLSAGIESVSIHGNKTQGQRDRALNAFRQGKSRVLVATDVAARGLDVDGVTHVFNFDLPREPEAYVHRIGRTGRAGATGVAVAFCTPEERGLLRAIERETGTKVPVVGAHEPGARRASGPRPDAPRRGARGNHPNPGPGARGETREGARPQRQPGGHAGPHQGPRQGGGGSRKPPRQGRGAAPRAGRGS